VASAIAGDICDRPATVRFDHHVMRILLLLDLMHALHSYLIKLDHFPKNLLVLGYPTGPPPNSKSRTIQLSKLSLSLLLPTLEHCIAQWKEEANVSSLEDLCKVLSCPH
jgi:hypothetical protein